MTNEEFARFFQALAETFDAHKGINQKPELQRIWSESLQNASPFHVKRALTEWITYNNRAPTVNDIALLVLEYQRNDRTKEEAKAAQEAFKIVSGEETPKKLPHTETDRIWTAFHLRWTRIMLSATVKPWEDLKAAYRKLARQHPELSKDCEQALNLYGEAL